MLSNKQFQVLRVLATVGSGLSQRQIAQQAGISIGAVNSALKECEAAGYIEGGALSDGGRFALEPYRVDNAIIMAAGLSSRFAPISYEKPKGLLRVRGEVLLERQIEQLQAAGIDDITIVVGYKMESFFYLRNKYHVDIVVNEDYARRNNNSTLWCVRERLSNTLICSSDIYYTDNPFSRYEFGAYYASQHVDGSTREWCMETGSAGRITRVTIGGSDAWIMLGHAYFDRAFSQTFVNILEREYDLPETADKLWESIYIEHIKELAMALRPYPEGTIHEFDSLDELREFDPHFMENVDSEVFDNIVSVLGCKKEDIHGFYPLKQGITNLSAHFAVGDKHYVYRHPGVGTDQLIDRTAERQALILARDLGLDGTFLYEDPQKGWKISRFISDARNLDASSDDDLKAAMTMARTLHESDARLDRQFDYYQESLRYTRILEDHGDGLPRGFEELAGKMSKLAACVQGDEMPVCVNHNDFFDSNFLIGADGTYHLIDWEYAGMSDCANDFGTFVVCCKLSKERADLALEYYFGRTPSDGERRHFWALVVLAGWCWYVWSLVKEAEGDNVDAWMFVYYSYAADYVDEVLSLYGCSN